jgi:hypothetical protein
MKQKSYGPDGKKPGPGLIGHSILVFVRGTWGIYESLSQSGQSLDSCLNAETSEAECYTHDCDTEC